LIYYSHQQHSISPATQVYESRNFAYRDGTFLVFKDY
jgi:hypothetical protein